MPLRATGKCGEVLELSSGARGRALARKLRERIGAERLDRLSVAAACRLTPLSNPAGASSESADAPCPSLGDVVMTANPLMAALQQVAAVAEPGVFCGSLSGSNSLAGAAVPPIVAVGPEGEAAVTNPLRRLDPDEGKELDRRW